MAHVFETLQVTVGQLFSSDYVFEFPKYQRPYRWNVEHADQLLEDVRSAALSPARDDYFLGSIVLAHHRAPAQLVIDGRQRLTTLAILLAVLRDLASDKATRTFLHEKLFDSAVADIRPARYRLRLSEADEEFFAKQVCALDATSSKIADLDILPERQRNIADVAEQFRLKLEAMPADARGAITAYLLDRCLVVSVRANSEAQGLRLFQVLNNRGLELSEADLMKPTLFEGADESSRELIADGWDYADTLLGVAGTNRLMRALCFILKRMWVSGSTPAMNVLTEGIQEVGIDVFHRDLLPRYVDSFSQLQDRSLPFSDDATDPNQFIQALGWLGRHEDEWAEWLPVALETVVRTYDDERGRFALLKAWERSCYLMRLNDVNEINRRITAGAVLDDLKRGVGEALGGRLVPPAKAVREAKGKLRGRLWPATLRAAITKRAEMAVCEALSQPLSPDVDKATAEHVLPKHPAPGTQWHTDFPSKAAIADSLDLLGNAALLTRSVDGRIGNRDFDAKRTEYRKYKTNTKFQLTKQVIGKSKWTREEIRKRTEELAKTLEKAWGI